MKWLIDAAAAWSPRLAGELALRAFLTPARRDRPDRERALLDRTTPLRLRAAGLDLAAWSWGDPGAPAVALVHGWSGRGAQLGAFVPALLARGRRVVTWDAPAHGDSPGRTTTLAAMATALADAAGQVGPFEAVIAHSFGGAATTIALARGLSLARAAYVAPLFTIGATVERFAGALELSPAARADFVAGLAHANLAAPDELEGASLAPAMQTPLYVVHDRDDREVPYVEGVATTRAWPGARLCTTGGLGHHRVLADDDVVAAVADFVTGGAPVTDVVLDDATRLERELANPELRRALARYL